MFAESHKLFELLDSYIIGDFDMLFLEAVLTSSRIIYIYLYIINFCTALLFTTRQEVRTLTLLYPFLPIFAVKIGCKLCICIL